jgi:hypothetical protein
MNAKMCSVPLSSNSELSTSLSGGEGGHSKSRALKQRSLLQRGPAPSYTPHAGDTSPAIPLFESHSRGFHALLHSRPLRFTPHVSRLHLAERVGFEPTVPLLGRMLSKHVDSSTLAPLRIDFCEAAS